SVAHQPTDEEDAERDPHVSEIVARSRADRRTRSTSRTPTDAYPRPSRTQTPMFGSGAPPDAAARMARMPQVGASAQAIGRTQPGKSGIGTRNPHTSQTGYSSMYPSAHDCRKRTNATESRKPSMPIATIV